MGSTDIFQLASRHLMGRKQQQWWTNFDLLRAFGEEHGHFNIPPGPLHHIATNIRKYWVKGCLDSEQDSALKAINFPKYLEHSSSVSAKKKLPKDVERLLKLEEAGKSGPLSGTDQTEALN